MDKRKRTHLFFVFVFVLGSLLGGSFNTNIQLCVERNSCQDEDITDKALKRMQVLSSP